MAVRAVGRNEAEEQSGGLGGEDGAVWIKVLRSGFPAKRTCAGT